MITAIVVVAIASFFFCFRVLRIMPRSIAVAAKFEGAISALREPRRSDREKEQIARRASLQMFVGSGTMLGLTVLAAAPSLLIVAMAILLNFSSLRQIGDAFMSYPAIAAAVVLFLLDMLWRR